MTQRKCLYTIRLLSGRRLQVEAVDAEEACKVAGVERKDCAPWYPFAVKTVLTEEEKAEQAVRLAKLKELNAERKRIRRKA